MQGRLNRRMELDTLAKRIKSRRESLFPNQTALAKAVGMQQGDISKLEAGDIQQTTKIAQLARALQCDAYWLATGIGSPDLPGTGPLFPREPWTEYTPVRPGKFNFVVVVGQGAGGDLPERIWSDGDFPVGATDEYAEVVSTDPHAFIVKVVGPSMIPKFTPGDYALVEPGTEPDLEDDVLVRLRNGQTMIKRLLSRRGHIRLGSYNDGEVLNFDKDDVVWMYYIAYPVPARKIKHRV
jgi:phage repressor protein C with HTH and peptisase S24 domain